MIVIVYVTLLSTILVLLQSWVHLRQPGPYMDELFHIPQANSFCSAAVTRSIPTYDPSITTPPGLYLPNALLSAFIPLDFVCSARALRLTMCLFTLFNFVLTYKIIRLLLVRVPQNDNGNQGNSQSYQHDQVHALAVTVIPVSFFFSFLYYTDTPSTFYILLTWYFSLTDRPIMSAILAMQATLTRQTNLVWHMFVLFDTASRKILLPVSNSNQQQTPSSFRDTFGPLLIRTVKHLSPHIIPLCVYVAFLYMNKGVALGDKQRHKETFHHVTIAYFSLFHTIFYMPLQLAHCDRPLDMLKTIVRPISGSRGVFTTFVTSMAISIGVVLATGDYAHPFILSDNRHLTFYMYRRWIGRSAIHRLVLTPLYAYAPASIHADLLKLKPNRVQLQQLLSNIFMLVCTCAVLLPNPLFEPRYFIVPNLFLTILRIVRLPRQSTKGESNRTALRTHLVSAMYLVLSIGLVYLFTERSFARYSDAHMPQDDSPGRFMI